MYTRVKVYGERCSGTGFLEAVIRENFSVKMLGEPALSAQRLANMKRLEGDAAARRWYRRIADAEQHFDDVATTGGWRHARISPLKLQRVMGHESIMFVCVVREPWAWAAAMWRNPGYSILSPAETLEDFVRRPWLASPRDELDELFLDSPVALWRDKALGYFETSESDANIFVLRYEDLVEDPEAVADGLAKYLPRADGFFRLPPPPDNPNAEAHDAAALQRARARLAAWRPEDHYRPETIAWIAEIIGDDLLAHLDYLR